MDQKQVMSLPYDVLEQLQFCGHFLHYRMGGRVGKRRILIVLLNYKEMLQRDLQDILDVQSGSLSEIIIKMELEGLIEKKRSISDSRNLVIKLTPYGLQQAYQVQQEFQHQVSKMMSCFSLQQLIEIHHLLDIATSHWTNLEQEKKLLED